MGFNTNLLPFQYTEIHILVSKSSKLIFCSKTRVDTTILQKTKIS